MKKSLFHSAHGVTQIQLRQQQSCLNSLFTTFLFVGVFHTYIKPSSMVKMRLRSGMVERSQPATVVLPEEVAPATQIDTP